jgi:hypothetical protein
MDQIKIWWTKFHASFHDSETILFARVKLFLGMAFTAVQQSGVDVTSFVENNRLKVAIQVFFAWLIVDGTVSEWARKHRAEDLGPTEREVPEVPPVPPVPPVPKQG